jgi:hypothetical protein
VSIFNPAIHGGSLPGALLDNTLKALGMFTWRGDDIARHNLPGRPVFDPLLGALFLAGVGLAAWRARRGPTYGLPLIWTAVMLLPTVLAEDTPHFLRGVGVLPVIALFPALALDALWQAGGRWRPPAGALARAGAALALGLAAALTGRDYFARYGPAADTSYLFQAAAAELARAANVYTAGAPDQQALVDQRFWDSFASVRFLLRPTPQVQFYVEGQRPPSASAPLLLLAWPYEALPEATLALPAGALIEPRPGPLYRGDLETSPYPLYAHYTAEPCPAALCAGPALAEFEGGLRLLTAEAAAQPDGLALELTWQAPQAPWKDIQVFAQAWAAGEMIAQADGPLGTELYPSAWWPAGAVVRETRWLSATTEPGVTVRVGMYDLTSLARYRRLDPGAGGQADYVEIVPEE